MSQPSYHSLATQPEEHLIWQPIIFDRSVSDDCAAMETLLRSGQVWRIDDTLESQLHDLAETRLHRSSAPAAAVEQQRSLILGDTDLYDYGRWVYYPWCGRLLHVLPPTEFRELRLDRNRPKITAQEQDQLSSFTVGIVGLSVGNAIAQTIALEGSYGHLKLADFDHLSLSNMNRLSSSLSALGVPKTVISARQILERDPYAQLTLFHEGLTADNIEEFFLGAPALNALIEECDDIKIKFLVRERARSLSIPVLMETSDRGMLDIERFDQDPQLPLFHGLAGSLTSADIINNEAKLHALTSIVGTQTCSTRIAAGLVEINQTISTWPQLASDVTLGGASTTAALRRLALGHPLPSGRHYIDLQALLAKEEPAKSHALQNMFRPHISIQNATLDARIPELIRFLVEHAVQAPSGANRQPWDFYYADDRLWVVHEQQRSKNYFDVGFDGSYLALGAAIENMRIAAASQDYATSVELFPFPQDPSVVAVCQFTKRQDASLERYSALLPAIAQRTTNRSIVPATSLNPEHLCALTAASALPGCHVHYLTDGDELKELGRIMGRADRIRFLCAELHREAISEFHWSAEEAADSGIGMTISSLQLPSAITAMMQVLARSDVVAFLRAIDGGSGLDMLAAQAMESTPAAGLLTVESADPVSVLSSGYALERLWLTATTLGIALHPWTICIYLFALLKTEDATIFTAAEQATIRDLEARFYRLFPQAISQHPLFLFRLFNAPPPKERSLRLPLEQVLFYGTPATRAVRKDVA